jgi:hypothetical protein
MKNNKVAIIAQQMLDGRLNYLLGAERLIELREDLGVYANDPDFVAFLAVISELNHLREQYPHLNLDGKGLLSEERVIQESISWAKDISLTHCQSIAQRYRN